MELTLPIHDVIPLLPQRTPFVMIDTLLFADAESATCCLTIEPENIFVENGVFNEAGLLEHMAQTAAAGAGYNAAINNREVTVGYIGAVRNFTIHVFPETGSELTTEVRVESSIFDVMVITGKVHCNNMLMANCEMKVFIQNNTA